MIRAVWNASLRISELQIAAGNRLKKCSVWEQTCVLHGLQCKGKTCKGVRFSLPLCFVRADETVKNAQSVSDKLNCVAKTCNLLGWQVVCVHAKWLKTTCNLVTQRLAIRMHRRLASFQPRASALRSCWAQSLGGSVANPPFWRRLVHKHTQTMQISEAR